MAGAAMRDIRNRMKSVESTMHLTKAMQLVAASKLRRVKERADTVRPYFDALNQTFSDLAYAAQQKDVTSPYTNPREVKRIGVIAIAGDRGLAGGYNANIFRMVEALGEGRQLSVLPLGKRAVEFYSHRDVTLLGDRYNVVEDLSMEDCVEITDYLCQGFLAEEFDELYITYTKFENMLTQTATCIRLLPIAPEEEAPVQEEQGKRGLALFEPSSDEVFNSIVPRYVTGVVFGAVCDSLASELAARRNAMESATNSAQDMIDALGLKYNRARQGAITQEITEIVSGAQLQG